MSQEEIGAIFDRQVALGRTRGFTINPNREEAATTETEQTYVALDGESQLNFLISFDFDSAVLREDQKPKLANLCAVMLDRYGTVFQVIGHTDSAGSAEYNKRLSILRAEEVKRYFSNECGIPEERLQAIGVGEEAPLQGRDPRADENRRVEFQAVGQS